MKIVILDLGINNLNSVIKVFRSSIKLEDEIEILDQFTTDQTDRNLVVLPGLGHFSAGMEAIRAKGFDQLLKSHNDRRGKIVGICLGMQLLGNSSEESESYQGLGIISGQTKLLEKQKGERIPNIGWLGTQRYGNIQTFSSLSLEQDFYFVHSYEFVPTNPSNILCTSSYGEHEFVSGLISENVCAFQFHPEKSAKAGKHLVNEIIEWARNEV